MKLSTTRDALRQLKAQPRALRIAAAFYLLHILVQGKIAPLEISAFLTILFLGWAIGRGEVRPSFHILYFPLILYGIASSVSALINWPSMHPLADAMTWFKMLIFPAALILFRSVPGLKSLALRAQIIFAVVLSLIAVGQYLALPQATLETRVTGTLSHVMTLSGMLLAVGLLLVVLAAHWQRWWLIASAAVVTFALFLTYTRSVWLGWIVAVSILLILERPRWIPLVAAAALVFVTFMPMSFFSRLVSSFDVEQSSNLDRIRMAQGGIEMIKDFPVAGVGPAYVKEVYPLYRKADAPRFRTPHLHNNVIQLWAERGILGIIAYATLIILFLRECARQWNGDRREFAQAGLALAVGLAVAGLFEFNFGDTEVFYLMLSLMALVVAFLESPASPPNEPAPAVVAAGPGPAVAGP
ncbi:MAG TPA: O-antigen ligase family protein [Thermoanaerobaculia bacterium]|nr:O-antigen ligase family protein [Thermoanaerobaculia bacterium]